MENLGPVVVAVALFAIMGAITIAAIIKYEFDKVLKIWSAQIGVFGVIIGMMGTYFFAENSIRIVDSQRIKAIDERDEALAKVDTTQSKWMEAKATIASLQNQMAEYADYKVTLPKKFFVDPNKGEVLVDVEK